MVVFFREKNEVGKSSHSSVSEYSESENYNELVENSHLLSANETQVILQTLYCYVTLNKFERLN